MASQSLTAEQVSTGQEMLQAYLPGTLIAHVSAHPAGAPIWHETLVGSLMLCDMSGFTAMSERLARRGKEGAELMAGILNRFFERMLGVAAGWQGTQMKFGGDAMLLFFGGDDHALRAAACALEMQHAMPEFGSIKAGGEQHRLRMRIGIHSGSFFTASGGQPGGLLHYFLMGRDVNRTASIEGEAEPGQVVASSETAELLGPGARMVSAGNGCKRVVRIVQPARPMVGTPLHGPPQLLARYVMPPIAAAAARGAVSDLAPEHRSVTAVFVNLFGVADLLIQHGEDQALHEINAYVNIVLRHLDSHGGFLAASDAAETGDKLIALFGAPVSGEHKEASALRFAIDLERDLRSSGLRLEHRIGISSGFVFAGEIGARGRREYTVIGDSVNLAARLMTAARPGQVYVSSAAAQRAGAEFAFHRLRSLRVKGKSDAVRAFRLEGLAREQPRAAVATIPLIGRERELDALLAAAARVAKGTGGWAFTKGEPGIGKSRLVGELSLRLNMSGWRLLGTSIQSRHSRSALSTWFEPLRLLFGITPNDDGDIAATKLREHIARLQPEQLVFAPLIADLLSLPTEDEPMLRFLDARTRRQHLTRLIRGLLAATAAERPLLLVLEDVHLADESSLDLLAEVFAEMPGSLLVCLTSREDMPAQLSSHRPAVKLELRELPLSDARRLAAAVAPHRDDELDAIVAKAQGNPLFLEEMALSGRLDRSDMPQTINEVIMARLDRLPAEEKAVLRAAAVAGSSFHQSHLTKLLDGLLEAEQIMIALTRLGEQGFTREQYEEDVTHGFSHTLTQDVIYETLPYARRREMHLAMAHQLEQERAHQLRSHSGVLLHHFERAGDAKKTVVYAAMSGDRAANVFANHEAVDYYAKAIDALTRLGPAAPDHANLLERIGQCLEMDGRHEAASQAFHEALDVWRSGGRRGRRLLEPLVPVRDGARDAALCRRLAVSFERRSHYDRSLEWIERALAALPPRSGSAGAAVYASKSMTLFRKGHFGDAIEWGRRAVLLAKRTREPRAIAYAHNMLANSYIEEGSVRVAVRHLNKAIQLYAEIGDVYGMAAANNNLGNCFQALGMLDDAIKHYEISLKENERAGNDGAIVNNNIAEVLLVQGRTEEAVHHLNKVLDAHQSNPALAAIAGYSMLNLSRCALATGVLSDAEEHLRRGMRLLSSIGAGALLTEARLHMAELRLAQNRPEDAVRLARRALREARLADAKLLEVSAQRVVASAEERLGRSARALARLDAAVSLAGKLGADFEEALARIAAARIHLNHPAGSPHADVTSSLERAIRKLKWMGATSQVAEAEALLARAPAGRRPPSRAPRVRPAAVSPR